MRWQLLKYEGLCPACGRADWKSTGYRVVCPCGWSTSAARFLDLMTRAEPKVRRPKPPEIRDLGVCARPLPYPPPPPGSPKKR